MQELKDFVKQTIIQLKGDFMTKKTIKKLIDESLDPLILTLIHVTEGGKKNPNEVAYVLKKILKEIYGV